MIQNLVIYEQIDQISKHDIVWQIRGKIKKTFLSFSELDLIMIILVKWTGLESPKTFFYCTFSYEIV